jgi:hypothetical protein
MWFIDWGAKNLKEERQHRWINNYHAKVTWNETTWNINRIALLNYNNLIKRILTSYNFIKGIFICNNLVK